MDTPHFRMLNVRGRSIKPVDIGPEAEEAAQVKPMRIQDCYAYSESRLERGSASKVLIG